MQASVWVQRTLPPRELPEPLPSASATDYLNKIQAGDPAGITELYALFYRGVRFLLRRHLGPQSREAEIHEVLAAAVQAIRRGTLRDQPSVVQFVWAQLRSRVEGQQRHESLHQPIAAHLVQAMQQFLLGLSRKNREALARFYLLGQPQKQICLQLKIGENQFRVLRGKAKAHFAESGKAKPVAAG